MKTNKANKSNKAGNTKQLEGLGIRPEFLGTETNTGGAPAPAAQPQQPPASVPGVQAPPSVQGVQAPPALPYVNYQQRDQNRSLSTEQVLAFIREQVPQVLPLAEVIGKWVWVTFPEQPAPETRARLSQAGFHWNNHRKCWQHPCGQFATEGSGADPRVKYGTRLAAAA